MATLHTKINTRSPEFAINAQAMQTQVDDLRALLNKTSLGGGKAAQERHQSRGKLLVRDRINALLDIGSAFLEVSPLAAYEVYADNIAAAGLVAGIGRVEGVECMIIANDATVKGGTYYPLTVKNTSVRRPSLSKTVCPAFTWWIQVALTCLTKMKYSQTASTLAVFSSIKPI